MNIHSNDKDLAIIWYIKYSFVILKRFCNKTINGLSMMIAFIWLADLTDNNNSVSVQREWFLDEFALLGGLKMRTYILHRMDCVCYHTEAR